MRQSFALFTALLLQAPGTRVVLLGTGNPNADPDRSGPSVAIVTGGSAYLVDAGPGVVRRAAAAVRRGVPELAQANLKIVFLSHLHSDHTVGLSDLLFTPWVLGRTGPVQVYGPRGTRAMVEHLKAAYADDRRIRTDGWQPQNTTGWGGVAHEIRAGEVYRDSNVRVIAFAVPHGSWPQAFGYRFETKDRVIVVSGDTQPSEAIVTACNGCDVLVHEVYSTAAFATLPANWQRYHSYFHTSSDSLAAVATRAHPGLLVLYHQLLWGTSADSLVAEVRRGYAGRVVSGNDLDVF